MWVEKNEMKRQMIKKKKSEGVGHLAGPVMEHATLDPGVVSLSPTLGIEIT